MSSPEIAKRLADQANSQSVNLQSIIERIHHAHHLSIEKLSAELEPLAKAMAAVAEELRMSMGDQIALNQGLKSQTEAALSRAIKTGEILEKAQRWIRLRAVILLIIVAWGSAASSTIAFSVWQQRSSGIKQDAEKWRAFTAQWAHLSPQDRTTLEKILHWNGR